jgi:glycosyltransferase involved in cell wall biosynthesis
MNEPGRVPPPSRVVGLVAAYNEEATIARVVTALLRLDAVSEVVVVADGSTDRTADEARAAGAWVWIAPQRMGKGAAIDAALDWVGPADAFLLVDGDVAETASESERLLEEVLSDRLDLAIGVLPAMEGTGFGMVKRLAAAMIRRITGHRMEAPLSGQRAAISAALDGCRPLARGFGLETAMTIDAARLGFRVGEVPVRMTHRPTGRGLTGFVHRGRQGLHILAAVLPRALRIR